jgi:autotransporter-associated beta strand protein
VFVLAGLARAGTPPLPTFNSNLVFDVTNTVFAGGALGNGVSNSAAAIQAAINMISTNIVAGATGGTVRVLAVGSFTNYLSGPITLKSHVNLLIDTNATLTMLSMASWPGTTTFLSGGTITDSAITGAGTIDGQGSPWWSCGCSRPNFIEYDGSKRVLIQGVNLQNSPTFHIMVHNNNNGLTIQNIRINTSSSSPNTDGIDLASTNVLIQSCFISDGDDNIQIGSSSALASDITITNCTFGTGHGVSIGSPTQAGVNNLTVSNCIWSGTEYGIKIKTDRGIGGSVHDLKYQSLIMSNVNFAVAFYMYYNEIGSPSSSITVTPFMASTDTFHTVTSTTPSYRNITISNVTAVTLSGNIAGIIWGLPESLVSNVTLSKVNFQTHTKTFCVYNAQGVQIADSNLGAPNTSSNTFTLYNAQLTVTNSAANANLATVGGLASHGTNILTFVNGVATITDTNELGFGPITLGGSTLTFSQASVIVTNNLAVISNSTLAVTSGTNVYGGALSGTGPLVLNLPGSSVLTLQGSTAGFVGGITLTNTGTLRFNQGTNTWGDANASFDAGLLGTINNHSPTNITILLGALAGGSGVINSKLQGSDQTGPGVDTYVIGGLNSNTTFAGTITNGINATTPHTVALTKVGTGIFTVSGGNTYSGGTTVSNGTLIVNNVLGSGTGAGAVTVVSGATLGGGGVIGGPVTVDGTLAPGNSPGTLTVSNNLVVNGDATPRYELGTNSDLTVVSGNLTLGGTLNIIDAGGFTNTTYTLFTYGGTLNYNGVTIGTTPNPSFDYKVDTNLVGQVRLIVSASGSVGAAGPITGPTSANAGDSGAGYSIASVSGATNYTWEAPSGASVASGQGTTSITVNFGCAAVSGNVSVTPSNGGGSGGSSSLAVTVTNVGAAGAISGISAVCTGQTADVYSIASVSGATTYTWAAPSGASITSGQGTTSISVNWGSIGGNVIVTPANANGCQGSASILPVVINAAPNITAGPSPQTTCTLGSVQFTLTATGAGLTYQWRKNGSPLSDGGTVSQSTALPLLLTGVDTNDSGTSFDCVVSGTCNPPAISGTATLTVNPLPTLFNVTGGGAFCASNGVAVGLDGSQSGVDYQLQVDGNPTGSPGAGTGNAISFGSQTTAGNYTVVGLDATTGCANAMNGSATATTDLFQCWQLQYFGCTNCPQADASADPDGDGQNNMAEFLSGTDPTNSASALRVTSAVRQGNDVLITWTSAGAHTNAVQATAGDGNGGYATNFTDISSLIIIMGSGDATTNYTDVGGATNAPAQFYRVRLVP